MDTRYDPYYPTSYKRENPAGTPPTRNNPDRPPLPNPYAAKPQPAMSVGAWVGTLILSAIPVLNIILMFYWAFAKKTKPSKKTWARAVIVVALIVVVLMAISAGVAILMGVQIFAMTIEAITTALGGGMPA